MGAASLKVIFDVSHSLRTTRQKASSEHKKASSKIREYISSVLHVEITKNN